MHHPAEALTPENSPGQNPETRLVGRWPIASAILVLIVMTCHYYGGENATIRIHDCLDSTVPEQSVLAHSDQFFSPGNAIFAPDMGGIQRGSLGSDLYLPSLPYRYMSAFHAYVFDECFTRAIALLGMFLLLRTYVARGAPACIISGAACAFALLPYYPFGLCVAGQPLLFYAFLNLGSDDLKGGKNKIASLLIAAAFPFFSSLVLGGFALIALFAAYWVYCVVATRKVHAWFLAALVLFVAGYLVCSYSLIQGLLAPSGYVSSRTEFDAGEGLRLTTALKTAASNLLFGQYHAASSQFPFIVAATLLALATCAAKRTPDDRISWRNGWKGVVGEDNYTPGIVYIIGLLSVAAGLSLIYGLAGWSGTLALLKASHIGILRTFQFERVHWLHPLIWGVIFACALEHVVSKVRSGRAIAVGILVCQLAWLIQGTHEAPISFHQFFSPELFAKVRDHIGRPQESYRVVSLGIYPTVALYNGFYVADGYSPDYPLAYKHRFRKVMAGELAKSDDLRDYFDNWGSRCYLLSSELGHSFLCTKDSPKRKVENLQVDTAALRDLKVEYIISAVRIVNAPAEGLQLDVMFESKESPWQIYLYRVK